MNHIQEVHLEKMLSLQSETGKNYLKDNRVLILNADAIGGLRKNLICSLGTEKAKGLLIRYGFENGYRDAESIMRDLRFKDKTESYRLGVLFHTFVGMARVTPHEMQTNNDECSWFCKGIWYDSYEAEHHVKHFGPSTEPVCWSLVGYASGIMSAFWGERVIIREVSCTAKGDPYCSYIGKTLAQWGEEISPELHYYQETNLNNIALEQAYAKVSSHNMILKQSMTIYEQLTKMVTSGKNMSDIAGAVGHIIGGMVIVEDKFFRPIAYFSPTNLTVLTPLTQVFYSAKDIFSDWRHRQLANKLTLERRPVLLPAESLQNTFARLISPIIIEQDIQGYVSFLKTSGEFNELDQITLNLAASVFALKMMQTQTAAKVETRLKGNLINDLIAGHFDSENSIIERATYLGYNLNHPHQTMIMHIDNFKRVVDQLGWDEKKILRFKNELCQIINRVLNACDRRGMVMAKTDSIIILTSLEGTTTSSWTNELARNIQEQVTRQFPQITVSIGIGRICHAPKDFPLSYQEARRSLKVLLGLKQKNTVLSFDNLGIYGLLMHDDANQKALLAFMQEQLGKLLEYDIKHQTHLVETLHLYFNHGGSIKDAAKATALTQSGFKYRFKKICEVGGFNLKDPDKRFDLQMALKIWCITRGSENLPNTTA